MPAPVPGFTTNLGIPATPDIDDPNAYYQMIKVYNALRAMANNLDIRTGAVQLDSSFWNATAPSVTLLAQNLSRLYIKFSDAAVAGTLMTLKNLDANSVSAYKAGGVSWAGDAQAFSTGTVAAGAYGEVMLKGLCTSFAGLTPGSRYWVSNTVAGNITSITPATSGNTIQPIGFAITPTNLWFNPSSYTGVAP